MENKDVILKVENLSKQYRLGTVGTGTISHDLNRFFAKIRGKEDPYLKIGESNDRSSKGESEYVWALKDINFEVKRGEVLGVIGKNGAGKSTLLKILSKVTGPTTGSIKSKGRIASLLEVGTGFHPEMTGKENIFLNGAILGMTKKEINSKLDEIVSFSGCERYIDTPVKRYSSGMKVRLAFAVAAHLEPDILIVDEVLAVGDAEFQKKAIGKMQDISNEGGRTVLFVSHDMGAISVLTERVVVLNNGKVSFIGDTNKGIREYLSSSTNEHEYKAKPSNLKPKIIEAKVTTSLPNYLHKYGEKIEFDFVINLPYKVDNLAFSFHVLDEYKNQIAHLWIIDSENKIKRDKGNYLFKSILKSPKLYLGSYSIRAFLSESKLKERYDFVDEVCNFNIEMIGKLREDYVWEPRACTYLEDCEWIVSKK